MDVYQYDPLDLGKPAVRLVRLLPGFDFDPITCELFQAFLNEEDEIIPYEALSYTWGSAEAPQGITVNGKLLTVTKNLHQALWQLRDKVQDRILWMDAICINQDNDKERGHQVEQMGEIYKRADRVLFYLGESNMAVDALMDTLNMMGKFSLNYSCRKWTSDDERWKVAWTSAVQAVLKNPSPSSTATLRQGYRDLLGRSWFRRVWILQEAANARAGLVLCGSKTAKPWLLQVVQNILGITPDDHCQAVLDVMPGPWRSSSWWNRNQDLYTLLSRFVDSQATEPRDLIYALRGMSSDAKDAPDLYPDYTKFEEQLVRDTILFIYPVQSDDLAAVQLPTTVHELIFDLGKLGHRIYCKLFGKITRENIEYMTRFAQTQTWDLISPYRMQEKRWATEQRYVYSPSAISSRLLLAKLQGDQTGDAAALSLLGLSKDNLRTEHLVAAAENIHGTKTLETVLELVDHEYKITEEILVAAAKNKDHGNKMVDLLLHHPSCQQSITKRAAMAAAVDAGCAKGIMETLMKPKDGRFLNAGNIMDPDSHLPTTEVMSAILKGQRFVPKNFLMRSEEKVMFEQE
ncbi:heterokaryon incompatibility domain-containing protein [Trichoderma sp. SZMC 28014]